MPTTAATEEPGFTNLYPLAETRAAKMFSAALERMSRDHSKSGRMLAAELGYKTSVSLSHMGSGRAPIPVERVMDYVRHLKIDNAGEFMLAVLEQRYPNLDVGALIASAVEKNKGSGKNKHWSPQELAVIDDLESAAGSRLSEMSPAHYATLREVAADGRAQRRWASIPELSLLDLVRKQRPDILKRGITADERAKLTAALASM